MSELPFQGISLRTETITKRSRYLRIWRRRMLILTSTYLITIDKTRNDKITEDINLFSRPVAECAANDLNNPCAFKIRIQKRVIYIIADSKQSKEAWISAIETAATFCWKYYWTYLIKFNFENNLPSSEGEGLFDVAPDASPEVIKEKYYKKLLELSKDSTEEKNNGIVFDIDAGAIVQNDNSKKQEVKNDFTADLYLHLGMIYQRQKDSDKALRCCINCLTITKSVFGEKHAKVCEVLDILGSISSIAQQHQKAVEYYKAAVDISEIVNGRNTALTMEYYLDLGEEYFTTQQYAKSRECSNTIEEISKVVKPEEDWAQRMKSLKDKLAGQGA